jgi:large subunit ribosomal protein L35
MQKTKKSIAKRFKLTATGKMMCRTPGFRHLLANKSTKSKRLATRDKLVAVRVGEAVRIHEAVVFRLAGGRAARGRGLRNERVHLRAALATEVDQTSADLRASQIALVVMPCPLACDSSMMKIVSLITRQAASATVNSGLVA